MNLFNGERLKLYCYFFSSYFIKMRVKPCTFSAEGNVKARGYNHVIQKNRIIINALYPVFLQMIN